MENKTTETTTGGEVAKKVNCSMCNKEGAVEEFVTLQDKEGLDEYVCAECRARMSQEFEAETKNPNIILAIILGVVGAIIGGIVWYLVAVSTGTEIGYISIGLGYLVGMGVYLGSGKKRGQKLQIISAVIALLAIFVTEKFIFDHFLNEYFQANLAEFPQMEGQTVSISFFNPDFLRNLVSPIGLLIYAIGIYFAYNVCKSRKI